MGNFICVSCVGEPPDVFYMVGQNEAQSFPCVATLCGYCTSVNTCGFESKHPGHGCRRINKLRKIVSAKLKLY